MTTPTLCTIRLMNKNYTIKCPEGEEHNLKLATQKLNEQLAEKKNKFKRLDDFQALLLSALHVSHELVTAQKQQNEHREQLSQFISTLEHKFKKSGTTNKK